VVYAFTNVDFEIETVQNFSKIVDVPGKGKNNGQSKRSQKNVVNFSATLLLSNVR